MINQWSEKVQCGDLVESQNGKVGIVVVDFAECCGVRFNNSDEVTLMMHGTIKKLKEDK